MDGLHIFETAFGVIGIAGYAVGYFGKGRAEAISKAKDELLAVQDREIANYKSELESVKRENGNLKAQNSGLLHAAQGAPQLVKLTEEIRRLADIVAGKERS